MKKKPAAFYTYRNLRTGGYSTQQRGRVVIREPGLWIRDARFQVSEAGRQRVIREAQKNVHAFVVSKERPEIELANDLVSEGIVLRPWLEMRYNPYEAGFFYVVGDHGKVNFQASTPKIVGARLVRLTTDGKIFAWGWRREGELL